MSGQHEGVVSCRENAVGIIRLDRPNALNALSHEVVAAISEALLSWKNDPTLSMVIIEATPGKAFCAGGDLKQLYALGATGNFDATRHYWRDEYAMNALIAAYPKPVVALVDGMVMGGGVGLYVHASHRVVTDNTVVAMPECAVGLIPDVGVMSVLAQMPGHLGEYSALTGARMKAGDAVATGFADYQVLDVALPDLRKALTLNGRPDVIGAFAKPSTSGALMALREQIDAVFGLSSVVEMRHALAAAKDDWSAVSLKALDAGSPISLACSLCAVRMARQEPGMKAALKRDFRFVSRCMEQGDFLEGIRAAVVDKDKQPSWRFKELASVPEKYIDQMFAPAIGGDLELNQHIAVEA